MLVAARRGSRPRERRRRRRHHYPTVQTLDPRWGASRQAPKHGMPSPLPGRWTPQRAPKRRHALHQRASSAHPAIHLDLLLRRSMDAGFRHRVRHHAAGTALPLLGQQSSHGAVYCGRQHSGVGGWPLAVRQSEATPEVPADALEMCTGASVLHLHVLPFSDHRPGSLSIALCSVSCAFEPTQPRARACGPTALPR